MSRLLTLFLLYKAGYLVGEYIRMEMLIEKTKETYYEALQESGISKNAGCARRSAKKAVSAQKGFRSFEGIKTLRLQILVIHTKAQSRIFNAKHEKTGTRMRILDS